MIWSQAWLCALTLVSPAFLKSTVRHGPSQPIIHLRTRAADPATTTAPLGSGLDRFPVVRPRCSI